MLDAHPFRVVCRVPIPKDGHIVEEHRGSTPYPTTACWPTTHGRSGLESPPSTSLRLAPARPLAPPGLLSPRIAERTDGSRVRAEPALIPRADRAGTGCVAAGDLRVPTAASRSRGNVDDLASVLNTLVVVSVVAALAPLIVALLPGRGCRRSCC